jgi:hypothetical protein
LSSGPQKCIRPLYIMSSRVLTNYWSRTDTQGLDAHIDPLRSDRRLFRKAVQQGRSKRRGEAYSLQYVELLSAVRTMPADFFSILLTRIIHEDS